MVSETTKVYVATRLAGELIVAMFFSQRRRSRGRAPR